jgi:iron complex transport system ATP-binding protein
VENGCFRYAGERELLTNINVTVPEARILAVLGPNGVGKTTLLKCVMGLLRWNSGRTCINGADIRTMPQRALWRHMAYVPQAKGSPISCTGEEMVVLGRSVHMGVIAQPKKSDYEKAWEAMETVGTAHLAKKICSHMSGGELQMMLMARALVAKPDILVFDEPESNLDFKNQLIVLETMQRLAREQKISCIFNTHYPDHALKVADDALLLDKDGRAEFGRCEAVICQENMRRSFEVAVHISHLQKDGRDIASVIPISIVNAPPAAATVAH